MPYGKRTIHLDFPDLSDPDDPGGPIWVDIRNPRFLTPSEMTGSLRRAARAAAMAMKEDSPEADVDAAAAAALAGGGDEDENTSYAMMANLVIRWHVYDATDDSADPQPFPTPATPEMVAKLPMDIIQALGEELAKANPPKATGNQEAGTSRTS